MNNARVRQRLRYLDWLRGVAVLVMILAHVLDAWTRPASRGTLAFRIAIMLGGLAAPLFLWLAGIGTVLSAESVERRTGRHEDGVARTCRRGFEIFVLAFLFRIQGVIVTPGGSFMRIFRVDILNIMGPSMVLAALVWGAIPRRRMAAWMLGAVAAAIALATPLVRSAGFVDVLPAWIQWHLRPAGAHTTFTLFPWSGFVLGGAATGVVISAASRAGKQTAAHAAIGLAGIALLAVGFAAPLLPAVQGYPQTGSASPAFFALRAGVLLVAIAAAFAVELAVTQGLALAALERLGIRSLFVYWIHVELVYGYATGVIHHRLSIPQLLMAYAIFTAGMYVAVMLRDRVVRAWSLRRQPPTMQPQIG